MTISRSSAGALCAILAATLGAAPSLAQAWGEKRPQFELAGGAFFPNSDTELRLNSRLGIGTSINLERDLGFESDAVTGWVDAAMRFGSKRRHRVDVTYF